MKIHHIDNLWVNPVASKEETSKKVFAIASFKWNNRTN